MSGIESRRGRRRRLTRRVALRRRHRHLADTHPEFLLDPSPENVDCVCETSAHFFAKKYAPHRCTKSQRGNPKHGTGCKWGRRDAVRARILSRRRPGI